MTMMTTAGFYGEHEEQYATAFGPCLIRTEGDRVVWRFQWGGVEHSGWVVIDAQGLEAALYRCRKLADIETAAIAKTPISQADGFAASL